MFQNNQQLINHVNWVLAITPNVGHKILKKLKFKKRSKIISFISTIDVKNLKKYTKNKNITRVINAIYWYKKRPNCYLSK